MIVLYSSENLNTRRNLAYKNYFLQNKDTLILNIPIEVSYEKSVKNFKILHIFLISYLKIKANIKLLSKLNKLDKVDKIVVLFPGIIDLIFVKIFSRKYRNLIIYDYFISFYQTLVVDRKLVENFLIKYCLYKFEKFIISLPKLLIVETKQIKNYIINLYKKELNISYILTPTDEKVYDYKNIVPSKNKDIDFLYWGTYINLHGLDVLLEAAYINQDKFHVYLLGDGQEFENINNLAKKLDLKNLTFDKTLFSNENKFEHFYKILSRSKFAIGTLSDSQKNNIVIPSKVIEAAALKIPTLTYYSSCIESYDMKLNAFYVKEPTLENLANLMKHLINNQSPDEIKDVVNNAFDWYKKRGSNNSFNQELKILLKKKI